MKTFMFYNSHLCVVLVIMVLFFSSFNNFLIYATYYF